MSERHIPPSEEQAQELRELIATLEFVFARTLAHIPHWYMRRRDNEAAFQILRAAIERHGVWGEFRGYRYLYLDDWKYWEIPPVPVINRARVNADQVSPAEGAA